MRCSLHTPIPTLACSRYPVRRFGDCHFRTVSSVLRSQHQLWNPGVGESLCGCFGSCGICLNGILYAVDGVALKQAVDAWVSAPASEQPAYFAVVQGIRGVEWGIRSYVLLATGLTLVLLAIVIISTRRIPRPIGYIMGFTGLAQIYGGYGYGTGYTSISHFVTLNVAIYWTLIFVWAIWLLVSAH